MTANRSVVEQLRSPGGDLKWSVHFAGSQQVKWALDEDLRWAQRALEGSIVECSLAGSQIVHSAWWPSAWVLGKRSLVGKQVVCFADNPPSLYARQPEFLIAAPLVGTWIVRSQRAIQEFAVLGHQAHYAPYCADPDVFKPLDPADSKLLQVRQQLGIPENAYLVGNFHRDTEFLAGVARPKLQKGADVFLEIVRRAHAVNPRVHVLLAGPRRHWLRRRLREEGVPVYFYGPAEAHEDDFANNVVDRATLNVLYNLLDVCLITSRWEGGPHSVLEAAFSKTKILSTRVGIAEDILGEESLYSTIDEGVAKLCRDAESNTLRTSVEAQYEHVHTHNQLEHLRAALLDVYAHFPLLPALGSSSQKAAGFWNGVERVFARVFRRAAVPPKMIGFLGKDLQLAMLEEAVRESGIKTVRNRVDPECRHYVIEGGVGGVVQGTEIAQASRRSINPIIVGWGENAFSQGRVTFLPSFSDLIEHYRTSGCRIPRPVILPPIRSTPLPVSNASIVETLSTSPEDAVEALLRTFAVAEFPNRVRWSRFL